MSDILIEPETEPNILIEPEPDDGPGIRLVATTHQDPHPADPLPVPSQLARLPLMDVLPADFPLPLLAKFVPREDLREAVLVATEYALAVEVKDAEGLQRADVALTALRNSVRAVSEHFAEPVDIANKLHRRLTGLRAEWCEAAELAIKTIGNRIWAEQRRLEAVAAEVRRKAQEDADRQARDAARREAELAAAQQAPAVVVEELKRQAATATAPPVATPVLVPTLRGSTPTTTWKARFAGTPAEADPNPAVKDFTPQQKVAYIRLVDAVLLGEVSPQALPVDWAYLNSRARSDKSTLSIPGIEAFTEGGTRAKSGRGR